MTNDHLKLLINVYKTLGPCINLDAKVFDTGISNMYIGHKRKANRSIIKKK